MAGRVAYYGGIVKDGLVLNLDAAKRDSYPGTGTTWRDISGNQLTGSLVNGPTFNSDNGGSLVFNGTNDYVTGFGNTSTFSFIQNTGIFTLNIWVRITDLTAGRYFLGNNDGTTALKGFSLGYDTTNSRLALILTNGVGGVATLTMRRNFFVTDTNWMLVTYAGNGTNCSLYKNGIFQATSVDYGVLSTGDSTRELGVGRPNNLTGTFIGNISTLQIYNRPISAQEVLQNYNATKSRYGL